MFVIAISPGAIELEGSFDHIVTAQRGSITVTVASDSTLQAWQGDLRRAWELTVPLGGGQAAPRAPVVMYEPGADDAELSVEVARPLETGRALYTAALPAGGWACSSHISGLRSAGVQLSEDPRGLRELLRYRYIAAPSTAFAGIRQLPAGDRWRVTVSSGRVVTSELTHYTPPPVRETSLEEAVGAVAVRLEAALSGLEGASTATLLSGGLDWSLLYRLGVSVTGSRQSYSTSYPLIKGGVDREHDYAESGAAALAAEHAHIRPQRAEYLAAIVDAIEIAEEPIIHLQSALLLHLFRKMPQDVMTVISGAGGDTLFGAAGPVSAATRAGHPWPSHCAVVGAGRHGRQDRLAIDRARRDPSRAGGPPDGRAAGGSTTLDLIDEDYGDSGWLDRNVGGREVDSLANRYVVLSRFETASELDVGALMGLTLSLSEEEAIWSKLAASTGRVMHYPFNDRELVDLALSIPWELRLRSPKHVLRALSRELGLPSFIGDRPKAAFSLETAHWAPPAGLLEPLVPLTAPSYSAADLAELRVSSPVPAHTFWTALNHALWRRIWIDGESADDLRAELTEQMVEIGS